MDFCLYFRRGLLHYANSRQDKDGLNTLKYTRLGFREEKLFTWIMVTVDQKAIMGSINQTALMNNYNVSK